MPRVKVYTEADVLTEAKKRIHHIFDLFDSVVVMFSGGKDSLATLHLTMRSCRSAASPSRSTSCSATKSSYRMR
jgi:predicted phosphoadenosine phosphosulfate sulfurtransferase